jgi:hypothetical protein
MAEANPLEKAMLDADIAINITMEPASEDADIGATIDILNNKADNKQFIYIL